MLRHYAVITPYYFVESVRSYYASESPLGNGISSQQTCRFGPYPAGPFDQDVFRTYLASHDPVLTEMGGRITILNPEERQQEAAATRGGLHLHEPTIFY